MLIYTIWISKLYKILAATLTLTYEGDDLLLKDELNAINNPRYTIKCDEYRVDVSGGGIINTLEREQREGNCQSLNIVNPECEWQLEGA